MTGSGAYAHSFLTERDRQVVGRVGLGARSGIGDRPVVLVIDVNIDFCGGVPLPILESVERWPASCGEAAWAAVDRIAEVLRAARRRGIPVIYTTGAGLRDDGFDAGRWADKDSRHFEHEDTSVDGNTIVDAIAPLSQDIVVAKYKPSAFFGTLLIAHLVALKADSVIVCGGSTSGCVRATVVDAFSHNLRVTVVGDGTFDRYTASHELSLFDMDQKYADVLESADIVDAVGLLSTDLFANELPAAQRGVVD